MNVDNYSWPKINIDSYDWLQINVNSYSWPKINVNSYTLVNLKLMLIVIIDLKLILIAILEHKIMYNNISSRQPRAAFLVQMLADTISSKGKTSLSYQSYQTGSRYHYMPLVKEQEQGQDCYCI